MLQITPAPQLPELPPAPAMGDDPLGQAFLVGPGIGLDPRLRLGLERRGSRVVAFTRPGPLAQVAVPPEIGVLVVECGGEPDAALAWIRALRRERPQLPIVLVNGGLTRRRVALAFRDGIRDYFASPYDPELLAERVGALLARGRRRPASDG